MDCTGVDEPTLLVNPVDTTDCVESGSTATVSFYLYGDNSSDPVLIADVGPGNNGPFDLVSGDYAVVHEDSQVQIDATFSTDPEHVVIAALPVDDDAEPSPTPVIPGETETPVTNLPSTGSGSDGSISATAIGAMGAFLITAIAVGGAMQVQRQR